MPSRVLQIGERVTTVNGYVRIKIGPGRTQYEHVVIAEKALGHPLPVGASVHHVDDDGQRNTGSNLCLLQDEREHHALHQRRNILRSGGDPWKDRICANCGPKPLGEFYRFKNGRYCNHCRACNTEVCRRERDRRAQKRSAAHA
jgi:hypothetical protein